MTFNWALELRLCGTVFGMKPKCKVEVLDGFLVVLALKDCNSEVFPFVSCVLKIKESGQSIFVSVPIRQYGIFLCWKWTAWTLTLLTLARSLSSLLVSFISLLAAFVLFISYSANALHRHARALAVGVVWKNRAKFAHFSADSKSLSCRRVFPWSVHFNDSSWKK